MSISQAGRGETRTDIKHIESGAKGGDSDKARIIGLTTSKN